MLFTNEHNAIRTTISQFIDKEINPYVDEWERDGIFPAHYVFKKMADLDNWTPPHPRVWGNIIVTTQKHYRESAICIVPKLALI